MKFSNLIATICLVLTLGILGAYAPGAFGAERSISLREKNYLAGDFTFSGTLKNGLFDHAGLIQFGNGDIYEGFFLEGRFDGTGNYQHFVGETEQNWQLNGLFQTGQLQNGTFDFSDGRKFFYEKNQDGKIITSLTWKYLGDFNEQGQNGLGSFIFADGAIYNGNFSAGWADGAGEFIAADGQKIYAGNFAEGVFTGTGIYYSPAGWRYEGNFANGLFDGEGAVIDGEEIVRGVWQAGKQVKRYEEN